MFEKQWKLSYKVGNFTSPLSLFVAVSETGGGALFSSAQVGAGHLHFVHFKFEQSWIGIELGSDAMASTNTSDAARGFWFVDIEVDGRYDYYKCPNKNPPGNVMEDGTLCAKSKWGIFGYAWADVRVIDSRIHDIQNEHSFYLHNKKGLVLIQNVTMERVGRTCVQSVNRNLESNSQPISRTTNSPGTSRCLCFAAAV